MFSKKPARAIATSGANGMASNTRSGASSFSVLGADLVIKGFQGFADFALVHHGNFIT